MNISDLKVSNAFFKFSESTLVDGTEASSEEVPAHRVILLVENNAAHILINGDYLESHGYEVIVAYDGSGTCALSIPDGSAAQAIRPFNLRISTGLPA